MTLEIGIVLGLLLAAVGLFATRALPVDLVTIFLLLALVLTGILKPTEAFAGFNCRTNEYDSPVTLVNKVARDNFLIPKIFRQHEKKGLLF